MKRQISLSNLRGNLKRLLRVKPKSPGAQDIEAMNNRNHILDALYLIDGRDKPDHPRFCTYTGLAQKYIKL
jgi:hypothetical protein